MPRRPGLLLGAAAWLAVGIAEPVLGYTLKNALLESTVGPDGVLTRWVRPPTDRRPHTRPTICFFVFFYVLQKYATEVPRLAHLPSRQPIPTHPHRPPSLIDLQAIPPATHNIGPADGGDWRVVLSDYNASSNTVVVGPSSCKLPTANTTGLPGGLSFGFDCLGLGASWTFNIDYALQDGGS